MSIKNDPEKPGAYIVRVSRRNPKTGKPNSLRRKASSLTEAKRTEKELYTALADKLHRQVVPCWNQVIREYESRARDLGHTQKTIDNALYCINAYTVDDWGKTPVDKITTQEIRSLLEENLGGKSESHRSNVLKFIRAVFQTAVENGHLPRNPSPVLKFKPRNKLLSVLNQQQAGFLLQKAREYGSPWYPVWAMALYTGMRSGELFALQWEDVCLIEGLIKVRRSWNSKDGFKSTKSGDERLVAINPPLRTILRDLKLRSDGGEFVLPRLPYWKKGLQAIQLRMFLKGLGLPEVRFHDLRATWATLLLNQGVEPIKVMAMGGWKDMKTMMIYIRMAGIDIKGATDAILLQDPTEKVEGMKLVQLELQAVAP